MLTPACGSSWAQTAFTCTWLPSTKARPSICAHRLYGYLARIALAVVKLDDLGSPGPPPSRWSRRARFWERAVKPLATRPEIELPPRHVQPAACRTSRSLRNLVSYSLQANSKTREGDHHIDRNAQFEYINTQAKAFLTADEPVIK